MTIGISRSARLLLAQLVQAYQRGEQSGLSGAQLGFSLSVRNDRTTIQFISHEPPLQTDDRHAIRVLRANGFIERFSTIVPDPAAPQYVVTRAGITYADRAPA